MLSAAAEHLGKMAPLVYGPLFNNVVDNCCSFIHYTYYLHRLSKNALTVALKISSAECRCNKKYV